MVIIPMVVTLWNVQVQSQAKPMHHSLTHSATTIDVDTVTRNGSPIFLAKCSLGNTMVFGLQWDLKRRKAKRRGRGKDQSYISKLLQVAKMTLIIKVW